MENAMYAFMLLAVFTLSTTVVFKNVLRLKHVNKAELWPSVEATVQSGNVEVVRHLRFGDIQLPVFDFSYAVDQKPYVERFALSMHTEPADSLISKMVGRKITVQYDPQNPGNFYIPGKIMEGCKIEQKVGSLVRFYPRH